ncbi:hypothetical protein IFR05_011670 [Cadophora sp. M221]|nr:hypothetical protein IFR05_011670 [Cadophora sp. M221]
MQLTHTSSSAFLLSTNEPRFISATRAHPSKRPADRIIAKPVVKIKNTSRKRERWTEDPEEESLRDKVTEVGIRGDYEYPAVEGERGVSLGESSGRGYKK